MGVTKPGFLLGRVREVILDLFLKACTVLSSGEDGGRRHCLRKSQHWQVTIPGEGRWWPSKHEWSFR